MISSWILISGHAMPWPTYHATVYYLMPCQATQNNTLDPAIFSLCTHIMFCNHIYLNTVKHGTLFTCERHRCLSDLISIQSYISKSTYLPTILLLQHDSNTFYGPNTTITKLTANQTNIATASLYCEDYQVTLY